MEYLAEKLKAHIDDPLKYIRDVGWKIPDAMWNSLSPVNQGYAFDAFCLAPPSYFENRLKALGFVDMDQVLDAGSGHGRWSLPLATLNRHVELIDQSEERLNGSRLLLESHDIINAGYQPGRLEAMPFENDTFDGVFSYSAIMFTNMTQTLSEFGRVLKTRGKLYLNYNGIGWYIHLFLDRGLRRGKVGPMKSSLKFLYRTISGRKKGIIITNDLFDRELEKVGFRLLNRSFEAGINRQALQNGTLPIHPIKLYGMPGVVEVLCEKV